MKNDKSKKDAESTKSKSRVVISIALFALIILLLVIFFVKASSKEYVLISEHDPVIGQENAPVTVLMISKHQCSISQEFFSDMYPVIKSKYIDTGKIKFVYKNFYPTDAKHIVAAEASLCANDQGMFWSYNSILFDKEKEWVSRIDAQEKSGLSGTAELFNPIFNQYALELKLDEAIFLECLHGHKYIDALIKDYEYATELGISETPVFLVNGLRIDGMPSFKDFESLLLKFNYNQ